MTAIPTDPVPIVQELWDRLEDEVRDDEGEPDYESIYLHLVADYTQLVSERKAPQLPEETSPAAIGQFIAEHNYRKAKSGLNRIRQMFTDNPDCETFGDLFEKGVVAEVASLPPTPVPDPTWADFETWRQERSNA